MMAAWQRGRVETNGIRLAYTRTGAGAPRAKPPFVLAHGVTDNGLCWTPVAAALAPEYDVVMVDARGHGASDAPPQGYDPATQADDLAGVITALGLHRPIVLGHSMGAATTLVLAGRYPDLPRAILLEDPPGWWVTDATPQHAEAQVQAAAEHRAGMQAWFADLQHKTRADLVAEQRAAAPSWSEAEVAPWADAKLQVSPHVLRVFDPEGPRMVDWPAILRSITCPALLLTADPELGAILTEEDVTALQALVPQLQVVHIAGAGHSIRREQFQRYLEAVRTFLAAAAG